MMKFVSNPNLPIECCKVIIGEKYYDLLNNSLKKHGITAIKMQDNPNIDYPVRAHADMSILHAGGECIFLAGYLRDSELFNELIEQGMIPIISDMIQASDYPNDVGLNICIIGNKVICSKWSDRKVVDYLTSKQYSIYRCNQGYARCSVCVVSENAIITADRGIAEICRKANIDVLLISSGYFELDGYDYGFIGGASFKISSNKLAFTGSLEKHPDKNKIIEFLSLHNVEPVYLTDFPVFDIGTAIPAIER